MVIFNFVYVASVSYNKRVDDKLQQVVVPLGVVSNIIREKEMIESERKQSRKINLILRNFKDNELFFHAESGEVRERQSLHTLTDDELEYLGF